MPHVRQNCDAIHVAIVVMRHQPIKLFYAYKRFINHIITKLLVPPHMLLRVFGLAYYNMVALEKIR